MVFKRLNTVRAGVCMLAATACHLFVIAFLVLRQEVPPRVDHGITHVNLPYAAPLQVSLTALQNVFEPNRQPVAELVSNKENQTASTQESLHSSAVKQSDISDAASIAAEPADLAAEILLPHYFAEEELAKKPAVIRRAESLHLDGASLIPQTVIVQLLINELGRVDRVLVDMPEFNAMIHDAIVEAYSAMIFIPGKINGLPVKCQVSFQISI